MTYCMTHLPHDLSHPLGAINQMCQYQFQQASMSMLDQSFNKINSSDSLYSKSSYSKL